MIIRRALGIFALALAAVPALAANVVVISAAPTSGPSAYKPVMSWSTTPTATSCLASGDWSGAKAPAGNETIGPYSASSAFTLTCTFPPLDTKATISWLPVTQNTNNTAYADGKAYVVYYGTSAGALTQRQQVAGSSASKAIVTGLAPGTWYFSVVALNNANVESERSAVVSKTIMGPTTQAATATITIIPPASLPKIVTGLSVQ